MAAVTIKKTFIIIIFCSCTIGVASGTEIQAVSNTYKKTESDVSRAKIHYTGTRIRLPNCAYLDVYMPIHVELTVYPVQAALR